MKLDQIAALIFALLLGGCSGGCSTEIAVSSFKEAEKDCPEGWVRMETIIPGGNFRFLCKDGNWGKLR